MKQYEERPDCDSGKQKAPRSGEKKRAPRALVVVLLVLVVLVGSVLAYWAITTRAPEKAIPSAEDLNADHSEAVKAASGRYYTLLIVGKDVEKNNTDTMMFCRYDSVERKLNVCSLPRDAIANIPSDVKKLNNAYASGGCKPEALLDAVRDIAGFRPDSYVIIDTKLFVQMIDALGGVDFDVPTDMVYEDDVQNLSINVKKGYQHLDGENTMKVFRFRDTYKMGDIERIGVQHDLIKACASQWISLGNWTKLLPAAQLLVKNATTNLSYGNMQWYAKEFMQMRADDIAFSTVPVTGCKIRGYWYASIVVDDWLKLVNGSLNPTGTPITKEDCSILYQLRQESSSTSITAQNYAVTNGAPIAGGIESFRINKG